MGRIASVLWPIGLILAGLLVPLWYGLREHPDLAVRSTPRRTHGGLIGIEAAPGQRFLSEGPGLKRIDVALTPIIQFPGELELVLRADSQHGEVLRRVTLLLDPKRRPQFNAFEFEPIEDSTGRYYHFEVRPTGGDLFATHAVWIRYHGNAGYDAPWGDEFLETQTVENSFLSPLDDLRAVAVVCEDLSTTRGPVRFELWESGESKTLVSVDLPSPTVIRTGYLFFSFPPIPNCAGKRFSFRVTSDGAAKFVGRKGSVSFKSFHGVPGGRPGLQGMTQSGEPLTDRDLVFRTWSSKTRLTELREAYDRAGWKLWAAMICWVASVLAISRAFSTLGIMWNRVPVSDSQ